MTTTYGGYTVQQLREFIAHTFNTEHGGDTIDELAGDTAASANIVRDLLDAIEPPHGGDLLAPVACWVYSAVRVNLDLLHAICTEFGCQQGDDVAQWLRARLAASPVEQPAAAPACKRCGATTAQACNDRGCFYLESGDGEPAASQPPAQADAREGLTDAVVDAAKAVVREALDSVSVHPCDEHDDEVRARQLPDLMQKLYRALLQGANRA